MGYISKKSYQIKQFITYDHFKEEKVHCNTIANTTRSAENESGERTAQGSGGIAKIILEKNSKHLKVIFNHINLVLSRQAASKGNCYLQWRQHK